MIACLSVTFPELKAKGVASNYSASLCKWIMQGGTKSLQQKRLSSQAGIDTTGYLTAFPRHTELRFILFSSKQSRLHPVMFMDESS